MRTQTSPRCDWAFVLPGLVAMGGFIAITALAATEATSMEVIAAFSGLLLVFFGVMLVAMIVASFTPPVERRLVDTALDEEEEAVFWDELAYLELMESLPVKPGFPVGVRVTDTDGVCPLGFKRGDTWSIGEGGRLSRPICRPAVNAFNLVLESWAEGDWEQEIPCRCPFGDRDVVFSLEAESVE